MKANAPEKIYMPTILAANTVKYKEEGSIEYTLTDAFIEKACEWLRTHSEADYFELIPCNYCGAGNLNKKRMIEDFKKYMED
jgi:hypothetical protein